MFRNDPPWARRLLAAIVVAYVALGVAYGFASPLFESSDEVRHAAMVEHYWLGNGLPVQDPSNLGFYEQEGSQAPLYYWLMTPLAKLAGMGDFRQLAQFNPHSKLGFADTTHNWNMLIHAEGEWAWPWRASTLATLLMRWAGLLMGAVTVVATYGLARALVPPSPEAGRASLRSAPLLAAALTAFNPMFLYVGASVNNDVLVVMLCSLAVWLAARAIGLGATTRRGLVVGVLIGLAALTKSSALSLALVVPLALLFAQWRERHSAAGLVRLAIGLYAPIALIAGWWYVRNAALYGDFTGTWMQATIDGLRDPPIGILGALSEWTGFRQAYWGLFGGVNIPMPSWAYTLLDLLALAGLAGGFGLAAKWLRRRAEFEPQLIALAMCAATALASLAAIVRWTMLTYASQGRLLFPVIAIISSLIALGLAFLWDALAARVTRPGPAPAPPRPLSPAPVLLLALPLIGLAVAAPLAYIGPAYARPPRGLSESQLPSDLTRTELRFGDGIRWVGFRVAPETARVGPGDELDVTLYWQALKPMDKNFSAGIRLFDRLGRQLALIDTYPGRGMLPTSQWRPGEIIADRYRIRIPNAAGVATSAPTALRLDVGVWDNASQTFLDTFDGAGRPTSRQRYEAASLNTAEHVASALPSGQRLDKARVADVRTRVVPSPGGNVLEAQIDWVASANIGEDFTTFAHLFDAAGRRVAQADQRQLNGGFGTRWWRAMDEIFGDTYTLALPSDLPAGDYTLKFGLYRPSDGARMPAFDARGNPIADAALSAPVRVERR